MRRSCGCARSRPRCRLSALREVTSPARSAGRRSRDSARNPGSRPWRLARARPPRWRFRCYQPPARRARHSIYHCAGAGRHRGPAGRGVPFVHGVSPAGRLFCPRAAGHPSAVSIPRGFFRASPSRAPVAGSVPVPLVDEPVDPRPPAAGRSRRPPCPVVGSCSCSASRASPSRRPSARASSRRRRRPRCRVQRMTAAMSPRSAAASSLAASRVPAVPSAKLPCMRLPISRPAGGLVDAAPLRRRGGSRRTPGRPGQGVRARPGAPRRRAPSLRSTPRSSSPRPP